MPRMSLDTVPVNISVPAKFRAKLDGMKDAAGMTRSEFVKLCVLEAGPAIVKKAQSSEEVR